MPTAYEQTYGEVTFYDLSGTKLYAMTADLGLWLVEDTEPSPDPKWVRVDVPGADGAVDLSRALAGQVTYEMRDITLRFGGKRADHATALALVRTLRSAMHGAKVRVATMLTGLVGGYYVADCECDGTAYAGGEVEIEVRAWADPFIRVGTQTLALTGTAATSVSRASVINVAADLAKGAGKLTSTPVIGWVTPMGATTGRLWYARGASANAANVLDVTRLHVAGEFRDGYGTNTYDPDVQADGHIISLGDLNTTLYKRVWLSPFVRSGVTVPDYGTVGIPFVSGNTSFTTTTYFGVYLSGAIDSVSSPRVKIGGSYDASNIDTHGIPDNGVESDGNMTQVVTLAAGNYDGSLALTGSHSFSKPASTVFFEFHGIVSNNLKATIVATKQLSSLPATFEPPNLGYVEVDFGGTFCRTQTNADSAVISPMGVTTTHNCRPDATGYHAADVGTAYTTDGSVDGWLPSDAVLTCMSVVNAYNEDCPVSPTSATYYAIATATGSNTTMRSTPSVTSTGGAYIAIGGRTAIVGAGTVELQGLTVPGGSFSVDYATLDGASGSLTWEGGVL